MTSSGRTHLRPVDEAKPIDQPPIRAQLEFSFDGTTQSMPEIRQNLATKKWVVIATDRARRPHEFADPDRLSPAILPEYDPTCPFCPGNEELDLEVMRVPETGPWQLRVVGNRYPALHLEGTRERVFEGVQRKISAVGYHEIMVESPRHNTCHGLESPAAVTRLLETFQLRGQTIANDGRIEQIVYFKNHGPSAGASLVHPHAQLVGLPVVPYSVRSRTEEARRFYDDSGDCVLCHMLAEELKDGRRLIAETQHFVSFIPYAAFSPFHTWILPRRHQSCFRNASAEELVDLGEMLYLVLNKIFVGLNNPDYNYIIRSAPINDMGREYLHWYVTLVPRVTQVAGFEMGSGMFINTALPEESAEFLRSVGASDQQSDHNDGG